MLVREAVCSSYGTLMGYDKEEGIWLWRDSTETKELQSHQSLTCSAEEEVMLVAIKETMFKKIF